MKRVKNIQNGTANGHDNETGIGTAGRIARNATNNAGHAPAETENTMNANDRTNIGESPAYSLNGEEREMAERVGLAADGTVASLKDWVASVARGKCAPDFLPALGYPLIEKAVGEEKAWRMYWNAGLVGSDKTARYLQDKAEAAKWIFGKERSLGRRLEIPISPVVSFVRFKRATGKYKNDAENKLHQNYCGKIERRLLSGEMSLSEPVKSLISECGAKRDAMRANVVVERLLGRPTGEVWQFGSCTVVHTRFPEPDGLIKPESVALYLTDPPYGSEFDGPGRFNGSVPNMGKPKDHARNCGMWAKEFHRTLIPGGVVIAFQSTKRSWVLKEALCKAGFVLIESLFWDSRVPHLIGNGSKITDHDMVECPLSTMEEIVIARRPYGHTTPRRQAVAKGIETGFRRLTESDVSTYESMGVKFRLLPGRTSGL